MPLAALQMDSVSWEILNNARAWLASRWEAVPFEWRLAGAVLSSLVVLWIMWRAALAVLQRRRFARLRFVSQRHRDARMERMDAFLAANPQPAQGLCDQITSSTVAQIVENTTTGVWKVESVLLAFCHKAAGVHGRVNCLTEVLFDEALQDARCKDRLDAASRVGPLFGVPISLKDNVGIRGVASSIGSFKWKGGEDQVESADVVELLIAAGAIPFCKTNVPQTMMTFECRNPLWGVTENPTKAGFTCGGSSGGEAALIGGGGSVLGLGSDIGGSLRIPAHFSGICALKPSAGRISHTGCRIISPAPLVVAPVLGPMARTVGDLVPLMRACWGKAGVDVVPCGDDLFKGVATDRVLTFGVVKHNGFMQALPPCHRAVSVAAKAVEAAGHRVVEFVFPKEVDEIVGLFYAALAADGGYFFKEALEGEPIDEAVSPFLYLMSRPRWMLCLFAKFASLYPDSRIGLFLRSMGARDARQVKQMLGDRVRYISLMNKVWRSAGIDALIMPASATPAIPHGTFVNASFAASYTFIWNLLDYVAGVVPVTTVSATEDRLPAKRGGDQLNVLQSSLLLEAELEHLYCEKRMEGLPVGVQIVTPQYCEGQALHAMEVVEKAIGAFGTAP